MLPHGDESEFSMAIARALANASRSDVMRDVEHLVAAANRAISSSPDLRSVKLTIATDVVDGALTAVVTAVGFGWKNEFCAVRMDYGGYPVSAVSARGRTTVCHNMDELRLFLVEGMEYMAPLLKGLR